MTVAVLLPDANDSTQSEPALRARGPTTGPSRFRFGEAALAALPASGVHAVLETAKEFVR